MEYAGYLGSSLREGFQDWLQDLSGWHFLAFAAGVLVVWWLGRSLSR